MNILVTMPKEYWTDTFLTPFSKKKLEALGNVTYNPYDRNYTDDELKAALKGIDVVFCCWGSHCYGGDILEAADSLKILAYCAGSVAGVVSPELYEKGVTVLSANCVFAESVAESCVCYTMVGLRRIEKYAKIGKNDPNWEGTADYIYNEGIMDRTIGLVGFGAIAQKFVKFIKPYRTKILVCSRHLTKEEADKHGVEIATLDEIFEKSDVVSVHQGMTETTYHMIGKKQLDKMKDGALIINTARGAVINEEELIEVLKTGRINAVLDVFEVEPLAADSALRKLENVTILPHMGGPTIDRRQYCVTQLVDDIIKLNNGEKDLESYIPFEHVKNMTRKVKK